MDYTEEQLEELAYSGEYASWLMEHAIDYDVVICNGHTLTNAMEKQIGFADFLISLEKK